MSSTILATVWAARTAPAGIIDPAGDVAVGVDDGRRGDDPGDPAADSGHRAISFDGPGVVLQSQSGRSACQTDTSPRPVWGGIIAS